MGKATRYTNSDIPVWNLEVVGGEKLVLKRIFEITMSEHNDSSALYEIAEKMLKQIKEME